MTPPEFPDLFAYVGRDELNPANGVGLKQGMVPAGYIPLVSIDRAKLERAAGAQMAAQARHFGTTIYLVRYVAVLEPITALRGGH